MTVRVVLQFDDEAEAKEFVKAALKPGYLHYSKTFSTEEGLSIGMKEVLGKVIAVFKMPTKFCDPSDGHRSGRKTYQGWTRGKKYGWWVCARCGKPTKLWASGRQWVFSLGFNLLPKSISEVAQAEGGWAPGVNRWTEEECGVTKSE